MAASISVHLYALASPAGRDIRDSIARIASVPKGDRFRKMRGSEMAMLDMTASVSDQDVLLLDFVKRREVGPGKLRVDSEIESFRFRTGEHFGEETAALVDVKRGWMAVQWNLHGVRAQTMGDYLNQFDPSDLGDWLLTPKLDPSVEQRLAKKDHLRVAEIKVKLTNEVTEVMRNSGVGLGAALVRAGREAQTTTLAVEMSMSHQAGFLQGNVAKMCAALAQLGGSDVKTVKIKAREGDVGRDEVIDLLEERIVEKYSSQDLEIEGGRYTQDSRWRAMLRLHAGWLTKL